MSENIQKRLDLLRTKERDLRDRSTLAQTSLDNSVRLESMLSAVTVEIAQLEIARDEMASQKARTILCSRLF